MKKRGYEITRDINVVDDLIHESFIKLIGKISILRSLNCYKRASYIVNTVKNTSIDYIRKRDTRTKKQFLREENDMADIIADMTMTAEETCIMQEDFESLGELMNKLSERDRNLLYNKYIFELSNREISELMDIPVNNIRQYLVRARKRALKLLESKKDSIKSED